MVNKDMTIMEIIIKYPETLAVFESYHMACSGCMGAMDETLYEGAKMHGIKLEELLKELNGAIS